MTVFTMYVRINWVMILSQEIYPSDKICVTLNKIENYLLSDRRVHYPEFADIGYASGDGQLLFQEIERQFDIQTARECCLYADGAVEFIKYMYLGRVKKRTFKTVWRIDTMSPLPRFITAYRDKGGEKYVRRT